ncbi:unnamed protein product [Owenia fusiformis]|uniref:Uncharacterized protein n=1 Tax=Owenia fusiformis TaxID=6347 RepID=A0A8S4Q2L9_OWEFU|nr:unnamed protein product [Owenia fusiformis]
MNLKMMLATVLLMAVCLGGSGAGDIGREKRHEFEYVKGFWSNCRIIKGPPQWVQGKTLQYLDRHYVACGSDEFLVSWKMQRLNPNVYDYQSMVYKCCKIVCKVPMYHHH